jgi:hypothetical protein
MKDIDIEIITKEILENWKKVNGYLGISRHRLESFSQAKYWKVKKVIAIMRKRKIIYLEKRYYFYGS